MQSYSRSRPVAWDVFPVKCCVLLFVNISCELVGLTSTYDKIHGTYDTEKKHKMSCFLENGSHMRACTPHCS